MATSLPDWHAFLFQVQNKNSEIERKLGKAYSRQKVKIPGLPRIGSIYHAPTIILPYLPSVLKNLLEPQCLIRAIPPLEIFLNVQNLMNFTCSTKSKSFNCYEEIDIINDKSDRKYCDHSSHFGFKGNIYYPNALQCRSKFYEKGILIPFS